MPPLKLISLLIFPVLLCTCGSDKTAPSDRELVTEGAGVDTEPEDDLGTLNEGNTDLYDVDPEDPYLLSNGTFLGFKPGEPLGEYRDALRPGKLRNGEGTFDAYFIDGAEGSELGYLLADPENNDLIGDIYITSPSVVTEKGVRVGTTHAELIERIGAVTFRGSELESRVIGSKDGLAYRLAMNSPDTDLDNSRISGETAITQIMIEQ